MQYGIDLPNMRQCADPRLLAAIAREAEDAGWDGVFIFDSVYSTEWGTPDGPPPTADPWIALAAMAAATQRVRLGPMIAPLARRRPWKVARETVTLDHLSNGRLVLPVGLGSPEDGGFVAVGEDLDRKARARKLDEALAVLAGLWSGEPFAFEGEHYTLTEMTFLPPPLQSPRVPVWVVGAWPRDRSMRRTLRWDGVIPVIMPRNLDAPPQPDLAQTAKEIRDHGASVGITPEQVADIRAYAGRERQARGPFDIVLEGWSSSSQPEKAAAKVAQFAAAGATWWVEAVWSYLYLPPHDVSRMRERIRQGPPRA